MPIIRASRDDGSCSLATGGPGEEAAPLSPPCRSASPGTDGQAEAPRIWEPAGRGPRIRRSGSPAAVRAAGTSGLGPPGPHEKAGDRAALLRQAGPVSSLWGSRSRAFSVVAPASLVPGSPKVHTRVAAMFRGLLCVCSLLQRGITFSTGVVLWLADPSPLEG